MRRTRTLLLMTVIAAWGARGEPASSAEPARAEVAPRWEWTVRPSADFRRLDVSLCFESFRPKRFTLRLPTGGTLTPAQPAPGRFGLAVEGDGYVPLAVGGDDAAAACVDYAVDVDALARVREAHAQRTERVLVGDPRAWLLAPALWPPEVDARVKFVLPEGQRVSAPWTPLEGGAWRLPAHALLGQSVVALGSFAARSLEVGGTRLDVAVLDGQVAASAAGIDRWLAAAASANAALYGGRFPLPRVQVLVEPTRPGGEPVNFGQAHQAGGAGVHLLLSASATDDRLPGEWVTVHEMTHLAMPWIEPADAWFSEGFVTYYQEVLRARAGFHSPEAFWQSLEAGFGRGRRRQGVEETLAEESRSMRENHAFHRVYWSGAALAFRLDLGLRAATQGKRSLDDFMRLIAEPAYTERLGWRATDLLAAGDRAFGTRVLVPGATQALASSDFPSVDDLYASVGVSFEGGKARLSDDPAQKALRESIQGGRK